MPFAVRTLYQRRRCADDIQLVAVMDGGHGRRFRIDFLVQVQRCGAGIGVADHRRPFRPGIASGNSANKTDSGDNRERAGTGMRKSEARYALP